MFKKVLSLVLALALCVGACVALSSCGKKKGVAALICLHGDNSTYDKNFIDAFKAACKAKGLSEDEYTIIVDVPEGDECYNRAVDLASSGYKAIFADSFGHEPYLLKAAKEFKDSQFFHATGTKAHTEKVDNFHDAFASIYEGRYLAGVAAGLKLLEMYDSDNDGKITDDEAKMGYVGAWPYAEVKSGYTAFFLGARSVVENVTMEVQFTNSWYDETAEKTTANTLIDRGAKLISQHADSMGAPTACEDRNIPNVAYNGTTGKDTFVIASKINWQPYFELALEKALNGTDTVGYDYTGTIGTGSVVLTEVGPAAAAGTQAKLDEVKQALVDGTLKVFDCSKFTVKGKQLTEYLADVEDHGDYVPDTNVIKTVDGVTFFDESSFRSAPYFDVDIDGISEVKSVSVK